LNSPRGCDRGAGTTATKVCSPRLLASCLPLQQSPGYPIHFRIAPHPTFSAEICRTRHPKRRQRGGQIEQLAAVRTEPALVGVIANRKIESVETSLMQHADCLDNDEATRRAKTPFGEMSGDPNHYESGSAHQPEPGGDDLVSTRECGQHRTPVGDAF